MRKKEGGMKTIISVFSKETPKSGKRLHRVGLKYSFTVIRQVKIMFGEGSMIYTNYEVIF